MPTVKELSDELAEINERLQKLESEYRLDKTRIIAFVSALTVLSVAFLGFTFTSIPGKVRAELENVVGQETVKALQETQDQIEQYATQIEQYKTKIEDNAANAEEDASEINKLKENLMGENEVLQFTDCGEKYNCTPQACLAKCIEMGMRMATYDEVYAWASAGRDHCAYMWMLDSKQSEKPIRGYPMYHNQTDADKCGRINTGDLPRMEGIDSNYSWESEETFDCACSRLQ